MNTDLAGKTCLITGANSGIGKATSTALAAAGATVVMVCRDRGRGEEARTEIVDKSGNQDVDLLIADLSSQGSVRAAVADFRSRYDRLHLLVNSAAVFLTQRRLNDEGLEMMFATNHLGPFLLTNLLLDVLEHSAPSRVITVTAPSTTRINFEDLQGEQKFNATHAFGATKTANLLFTYALARRLKEPGMTANACHPGLVRTNLMRHAAMPMRLLLRFLNLFAASPETAAKGLLEAASS